MGLSWEGVYLKTMVEHCSSGSALKRCARLYLEMYGDANLIGWRTTTGAKSYLASLPAIFCQYCNVYVDCFQAKEGAYFESYCVHMDLEIDFTMLSSLTALSSPWAVLTLVVFGLLFSASLQLTRRFRFLAIHKNAHSWSGAGKKGESEVDAFKNTYPPSRRDAVVNSTDSHASEYRSLLSISSGALEKSSRRTPTGFSDADIEAIGSFPDYALLSGVPHPKPCPAFDIHKAIFRPFRPFRWTYHQTMCE